MPLQMVTKAPASATAKVFPPTSAHVICCRWARTQPCVNPPPPPAPSHTSRHKDLTLWPGSFLAHGGIILWGLCIKHIHGTKRNSSTQKPVHQRTGQHPISLQLPSLTNRSLMNTWMQGTVCFLLTVLSSMSVFLPPSFFLSRQVSVGSPDCPGARYVDQADLELPEIHLPLSPCRWN